MKRWLMLMPALLLAVTMTASADIVVTEIMQNPSAVLDGDGEWFEVVNTGDTAVDLENWEIHDNGADSFTISGTLMIDPGQYLVFGINADLGTNGGVPVDYEYSGFVLANGDDEIMLVDADANLVDEVWYDGGPNFPDPNGASMALNDPASDNNDGANWAEATVMWDGSAGDLGTPGLSNDWTPPGTDYPDDLLNWSFEDWNTFAPAEWLFTDSDNVTFSEDNTTVFHGGASVNAQLAAEPALPYLLAEQLDSPFAGSTYRASLMVMDNDPAGRVGIYVDVVDADDNLIAEFESGWSSDSPDWQEIVLDFDMPADAAAHEFGIFFDSDDGWDGDATLNVDAANLAPVFSVAELQAATDLVDRRVFCEGVITQAPGTVHTGYVDAYLQDLSGYGIMLYDSDPAALTASRGDAMNVFATVDQYFDVTELVDFFTMTTSTGNDLPDPMVFQPVYFGDAIEYEGVWAEISGTVSTDPGDGSFNLEVGQDQGGGVSAVVRIWEDAGLDLSAFSVGDNIRVRGTMDVYFGEAQLQPSEQDDIEAQLAAFEFSTELSTSQIMPPEGGTVAYIATLTNTTNNVFPGATAWRSVLAPNGVEYGPQAVFNFNIPANTTVSQENITFNLPAFAPAGNYQVFHHIGPTTNNSLIWDHMGLEKEAAPGTDGAELTNEDFLEGATAGEWVASGEDVQPVTALPDEFAVGEAYPNPFNPSTSISVALPSASELTLRVYNVMGRQVAELANGRVAAGEHRFTFDASHLASGVYFLHAQVPGQLNELRKVTLMK